MMGNRRRSDSKKGSYWTRFTTLEKCQFLAVLVLLIILLIVIFTHSSGKTDDICQTPSCVKAAYNVLSRIDVDVDPCEDFYNYTCGKFLNETFLPDYESSVDSFSIVSDSVGEQVKTLLEKPVINEDPHHIKLVKNFYKACMNVTSINENSLNELKNIFEKVGGWPVVKGDQWVQVDWVNVYYRFQEFGFQNEVFLLVNVEPDFMNSSRNLISLDQPYISYKEEMLKGFNDPTVAEYVQYSIQLAKILGADQTRAVDEMTKVVKLHQALAEIAIPEEERRDFFKEYNLKTILQLQNEYPYIPWLNFMNNIVSPSKKRTYNDSILVTVPAYFEKLGHVLNDHGPRTVVNYLFWVALRESTTYLGDNVKNLKLQYKRLSFVQTTQPRWKECSYEANNNLNIAVGSLYIKSFFKEINRQTMIDIVDNIKNEFTETLSTINWMDEATKNEAIQKVQAMTKHIGYPDELLDDTKVSEYYEDLIINPDSYLSCGLGLNKFFSTKSLERLDEVIDKNDWTKHAAAAETNAFYDQNENSIQFPAGILQGVFFDGERPLYMNYGAIGFIVGHEITHGFDDRGRQYDKDGNLRDWWPNKTVEAFTEKAKCIQEQYGKIPVPGTNSYINVINTQGENIADNGGIKHAYLAYKKLVSKMGPERLLPGLSQYTPEQLFWISSGNLWCAKVRTEQITKDLDQQEHAPTYFRVNVPLMNNEDFAKDFNCAVGTRMNPPKKEKCIVW